MRILCSGLIGSPYTIDHYLLCTVTGKLQQMPSGMPYPLPSDQAPNDTQSGQWPRNQLLMWAMAALAALAALENPLASIISAPRFWTLGMNWLTYQSFLTCSRTGFPLAVAHSRSGDIVGEWLPHTTTFSMSVTADLVFSATCQTALSWSSRVMAQKFFLGRLGALEAAIRQLVLAGLPTIRVLTSRWAYSFKALPCGMKILAFSINKSPRSIPLLRGLAPTSNAAQTSLNPNQPHMYLS